MFHLYNAIPSIIIVFRWCLAKRGQRGFERNLHTKKQTPWRERFKHTHTHTNAVRIYVVYALESTCYKVFWTFHGAVYNNMDMHVSEQSKCVLVSAVLYLLWSYMYRIGAQMYVWLLNGHSLRALNSCERAREHFQYAYTHKNKKNSVHTLNAHRMRLAEQSSNSECRTFFVWGAYIYYIFGERSFLFHHQLCVTDVKTCSTLWNTNTWRIYGVAGLFYVPSPVLARVRSSITRFKEQEVPKLSHARARDYGNWTRCSRAQTFV